MSRAAGESLEFLEHRDYEPGDDLRRINWSAYARTDKLVVKVFRQEVCPHLDVVVDGSRSMMLAGTEKRRAALALAAAIVCAAENSGYSRQVFLTTGGCHPIVGGTQRSRAWQGLNFESHNTPAEAFRTLPPAWRPRGIRMFISDCLWLGDPLEILQPMADRTAAVFVLQLLAAEDVEPPGLGNRRLVDSETGETLEAFVDATGQAHYREKLARHQEDWHLAARKSAGSSCRWWPKICVATGTCRHWSGPRLWRSSSSRRGMSPHVLHAPLDARGTGRCAGAGGHLLAAQPGPAAGGVEPFPVDRPAPAEARGPCRRAHAGAARVLSGTAGDHGHGAGGRGVQLHALAVRPADCFGARRFVFDAGRQDDSARERAREALAKEFEHTAYVARVVLAGSQPRLLGDSIRTGLGCKGRLKDWRCMAPTAALEPAIALAAEVGGDLAHILVISDHEPAEEPVPGKVQCWAFGQPLANIAITAAAPTDRAAVRQARKKRTLLEITNLGTTSGRTNLTLDGAGLTAPSAKRLRWGQARPID